MAEKVFRTPSALERAFLQVVTRGYPELEEQVAACDISAYDPTGWLDVRVPPGLPLRVCLPEHGPILDGPPPTPFVEILLWTDKSGLLQSVEIVEYGDPLPDVYEAFVDAANRGDPRLRYRPSP